MVFGWRRDELRRVTVDLGTQRNGVNSDGIRIETAQEVQPEVVLAGLRDIDVEKQLIDAITIVLVLTAARDDVGQSHDGDGDLFVAVRPAEDRAIAVERPLHDGERGWRIDFLQEMTARMRILKP